MNNIDVLYLIYFLAVGIHVIAGIITLAFVIPLQFQQTKVKNGLIMLRKQMLLKGVLSVIVAIVSVFALLGRWLPFDGVLLQYAILLFISTHALGLLGKSVIDYKIYHQQYSEHSKNMHEKIHILEKAKERRDAEHNINS
jgi:hypothetical protein